MPATAALLFAVALIILIGLLIYWLVTVTEGAYLGAGAVRALYDRGASTYDGVKEYDPLDEAAFLANPLFSRMEETYGADACLLDVATGSGRLPLALAAIPFYTGEIVGLDLSRGMLLEAARKLASLGERVTLIHHPSVPLPFADASFDAVSCLEAWEFMPDRRAALAELVRVLKPGGWLMTSNRIGMDARLMLGRTDSPRRFEQRLAQLGMGDILTRPWQEVYDLVIARKPGEPMRRADPWRASLTRPLVRANDGIWEVER